MAYQTSVLATSGQALPSVSTSTKADFPDDRDGNAPAVRHRLATLERELSLRGADLLGPALDQLITDCYAALEDDVRNPQVLTCLGDAMRRRGKLPVAILRYQMAVAVAPEYRPAQIALGDAYMAQGKPKPAIACYDKCLALAPGDPDLHRRKGLALLANGSLATGWDEFDWQGSAADSAASGGISPDNPRRWDGTPAPGRSISVVGDGHLLQQVVCAHCLDDLIRTRAEITVRCHPGLVALIARSFRDVTVVPTEDEAAVAESATDMVTSLASLPRHFRRSIKAFDGRPSYLVADADARTEWRARYDALPPGLTVGIAWSGDGSFPQDVPQPPDWAAILNTPGVRFVSLESDTEANAAFVASAPESSIGNWGNESESKDLDVLAARTDAVDLVIAVAGTTAALAGALGKSVWTLAPIAGGLCWPVQGRKNLWFPSMTMFRRRLGRPWAQVMAGVEAELSAQTAGF